jgi:hypothetical protein
LRTGRDTRHGRTIGPARRCVLSVSLGFFWQNSCRVAAAAKSLMSLEKPVCRFARFELDPFERRLLAQGQPIALTPTAFGTRVLLVEQAGHAVAKDASARALWRGFVRESTLTKHNWLIRKALRLARTRWRGGISRRCRSSVIASLRR